MRSMSLRRQQRDKVDSRERSRGQILVLFVGSTVLFVLLCGVVVDIAYYWVGSLQAQRAADAAALAGAVYLPGDRPTAYSAAQASATQNGYTSGGTTTVTPSQDSNDPRQLNVAINARVGTFFSRIVGITSWPIRVSAKGVYVLPVPMGSPDAYYGVGNYSLNQTTVSTTSYTDASVPGYASVSPNVWTTPDNAWTAGASYATSATNNQVQEWKNLHIPSISGAALDGIVVSFSALDSATAAACQVKAQISWNNGGANYSNNISPLTVATVPKGPTPTAFQLGSATDLTVWGNNHTWGTGDFANGTFRVELTHLKGAGCGTMSLNSLVVTVSSHTTTSSTTMNTTAGVNDGATFLTSRGAWGAIITKGGDQSNGDAYAPTSSSKTTNTYNPDGYDYVVKLPAGGTVKVFDPGFCAMGGVPNAGNMGAGDHWIGTSGPPVSTYYTLWNTNGKPGLRAGWTEVYTSAGTFQGQSGFDPANTSPGVASGAGPNGATSGCDAYHNAWWTIPTGSLMTGTYAVQVQTTKTAHVGVAADSTQNQSTNAENMFALEAVGSADANGNTPQIYGNGKMVVYNNLIGGTPPPVQKFYLAQIDRSTGAGKTALIDLWDIGDISGTGTLRILSPDGGSQNYVNFTYTTDSSCQSQAGAMTCYSSGTSSPSLSSIITTLNGAQVTNGTWIHIRVPLPSTYGQALWNNGWWQVEYTITQGASDTTTWQVSVSGNPVHLVTP